MPYVKLIAQTQQLAPVAINMGNEWIQPLVIHQTLASWPLPNINTFATSFALHQHTGLKY